MKGRAYHVSRPMPTVSAYAARFVNFDGAEETERASSDAAFHAFVTERQEEAKSQQAEHGKRALRWAAYAIVSFIIATHTPGWWSFAGWCSTMVWGTGAIFQLEAANVARICSTLQPDD